MDGKLLVFTRNLHLFAPGKFPAAEKARSTQVDNAVPLLLAMK
jgi:hypothetical protein